MGRVVKRILLALAIAFTLAIAGLYLFAVYCDNAVLGTQSEYTHQLAGDDLITNPLASVTHAITIHGPPQNVWPWLAQMGSGRAGWYAYDFIDNGGHPSADHILPEFQTVSVGNVLPALPGAKDVFVVARCEPGRELILAWRSDSGTYLSTWAFVLQPQQSDETRLIVRGRVGPGYRPYGWPFWLTRKIAPLAHAIMERKQLLGIRRRAEGSS